MIERLIIFLVLLGLGWLGYHAYKRWQLSSIAAHPMLSEVQPGIPSVVLFTADFCSPCKTQQMPALDRLVAQLGEEQVQVIKVDVENDPQTANAWGVLSLPTTFILDKNGQPREVNHGVASTEKLKKQLEALV